MKEDARIKDDYKKYDDKYALQDISLTLSEGIYGILGPNGAGKSTLMNIITENLQADGGQVLSWDGKSIQEWGSGISGDFRLRSSAARLYDTFTGRRFLSYMGALKEISKIG